MIINFMSFYNQIWPCLFSIFFFYFTFLLFSQRLFYLQLTNIIIPLYLVRHPWSLDVKHHFLSSLHYSEKLLYYITAQKQFFYNGGNQIMSIMQLKSVRGRLSCLSCFMDDKSYSVAYVLLYNNIYQLATWPIARCIKYKQ